MTTVASTIVDKVQERLQDTAGSTYTDAQMLAWLNEAQRAICLVRPDAKSTTKSVQLIQGVKQSLAAGDRRLMGVTTNMGTDGLEASRGTHIDGPVDLNRLGRYDRDWGAPANESATVLEYSYNPEVPGTFWVNPPVPSTPNVYIEISVAQDPSDVAAEGNNIDLPDIYSPPMIEWMLYCAWGRDDERSPNYQRAQGAFQNFQALLGLKTQGDVAVLASSLERGG